ncbi:uncharacterized protein B0H18DRAFT_831246, partial [Fomitopsis serialis]|uniref:uncharacterized protein n=1 Tax=Fomitopsis serialis TaxID=139415 RepID=UPI002008560B
SSHAEVPSELAGALHAINNTPLDAPLHLLCATDTLVDMVMDKAPHWEDYGWIDVAFSAFMRALLNKMRQRCAATTLGKIASPGAWASLERARQDMSSNLQAHLPRIDQVEQLDLTCDPRFNISGARLHSVTQALAYKGILEWKDAPARPAAQRNIQAIRDHNEARGPLPDGTIWTSLRHRDFSRTFAVFLWKCVHDALRCGAYWLKIPGYEDRAQCSFCGALDSMQHILFECTATGQAVIWEATATLWKKKGLQWPTLTAPNILSLGLKQWSDGRGRPRPGATRLWRILISEAAYLIWKLRCERVIGHEGEPGWDHDASSPARRLTFAMNRRLSTDAAATRKSFGTLALNVDLVLATWNQTLYDEQALPEDW